MNICAACGTPIGADAPEGLCPRCLLKFAGETQGATADLAGEAADRRLGPRAVAQADTMLGITIGGYKIVQQIGEGGFGTVYLAEQHYPVQRKVALKILKLGMDTRQVVARFEAERQALAIMDHPNIARVIDGGATDSGRPYFVMELVRGVPITEYCDVNNLSVPDRLQLFVKVCEAVQHAHQKGIIHRDIKPGNVLVAMADGHPAPKVIDFGIAKATDQRLTEKTIFTEFRQMIGTPQYMSPEQAEMAGIDIDTRTDVYSLGVLLYELLVGSTPFDPKELRSKAYGEIQRIIREVEPPRPSTRLSTSAAAMPAIAARRRIEVTRLGQILKGELDWIVMRALEKDRVRRYDSAGDLAADIRRHLSDEPVLARPPSNAYRMRKFAGRHRLSVLSGAAVFAALVIGLLLATAGFLRASAARNAAEKAQRREQAQAQAADRARIEAQSQKQIAMDNARTAEVRFATGLISQADALSLAGRYTEAHPFYAEAYDKLSDLKEPLTAAEMGLWSSYHQAGTPLLACPGYGGGMYSVTIAPDGKKVVSLGADGAKVLDVPTGRELGKLRVAPDEVFRLAISPDSRTALSVGADRALKLWDLSAGTLLRTLIDARNQVTCAAFAPDGRTALAACYDGTFRTVDVATGTELRSFKGSMIPPSEITVSNDSRIATTFSVWPREQSELAVWDLPSGKKIGEFNWGEHAPCVGIAADGRTALIGDEAGLLTLVELPGGKVVQTFNGHTDRITCVAFSPDGRTALSGSADKTLRRWDLAGGKLLRTFIGHVERVMCLSIAPDGQTAVSGAAAGDERMLLWDLGDERHVRTLPTPRTQGETCVAASPDGRTVLVAGGALTLWDLATGKMLRMLAGPDDCARCAAFTPDGQSALSGNWKENVLELWDLRSGMKAATLKGDSDLVTCIAFAADGRTALVGDVGGTMSLWNVTRRAEVLAFSKRPTNNVNAVAFAPDGKTAISANWDRQIDLWDVGTGAQVRAWRGREPVFCMAISPDGRTLLAGDRDTTLTLWDLASGTELRTFIGHTKLVEAVAIRRDGRTAFSGGQDKMLKLWDLSSGKELRNFAAHQAGITSIALTPGGQSVITGCFDGSVNIWEFSRGTVQRALEPRVAAAQATLNQSANDPGALAVLGEWYSFRGLDQWALELLTRARENGAAIAPLNLARCYWNLNRYADARREFRIALEQSRDPTESVYLSLCIQSIDAQELSHGPD